MLHSSMLTINKTTLRNHRKMEDLMLPTETGELVDLPDITQYAV